LRTTALKSKKYRPNGIELLSLIVKLNANAVSIGKGKLYDWDYSPQATDPLSEIDAEIEGKLISK
jgi:hypothetical protein